MVDLNFRGEIMKTTALILLLGVSGVLSTWGAYQCCLTRVEANTELTITHFRVTGMTCGGCEAAVRLAVKRLEGITEVEASYEESKVTVTYDATAAKPEDIVKAIEKLGYKAEVIPNEKE
jgi:copper chaperone